MTATAPAAGAQMPGQPVLQNAWANPGLTVGVNFGSGAKFGGAGSGATGYAGALAWAPARARFQVSAGGGVVSAGGSSKGAWGGRVMVPVLQRLQGQLGISVFGGVGGASLTGGSLLTVPVGASVGYRHAVGSSRGISVYVAPFFRNSRVRAGGVSTSDGSFRVSGGVDVALLPSLGLTLGYEGGSDDDVASSGIFGVGISYALRRSR